MKVTRLMVDTLITCVDVGTYIAIGFNHKFKIFKTVKEIETLRRYIELLWQLPYKSSFRSNSWKAVLNTVMRDHFLLAVHKSTAAQSTLFAFVDSWKRGKWMCKKSIWVTEVRGDCCIPQIDINEGKRYIIRKGFQPYPYNATILKNDLETW